MMRLFVGLGLPPEVALRLTSLGGGIPGGRWVEARNLHITLRFIGEVEDGLARELHDELATLRLSAFALALDGFGTFGRSAPNHLWAGVEKVPELLHLQAKVETMVARLGLPPEGRKYTPHVTLARFKGAPVARVQDFIARNSPFQAGPWPVEHFTMFRSFLGHGGAEYDPIAEYPLELP
ncbi:MAG: RNA 2',3'-cyclic phosphodiesterase [Rhodospirillaceae bacterium]|nr:RNA 2',3'-cyclic phosphodiesterase [Rhodospirillales bacterium]